MTESLLPCSIQRIMSSYYDYLDRKAASSPAAKLAVPKLKKPSQPLQRSEPEEPMAVEESIASETIIERVRAFWRK